MNISIFNRDYLMRRYSADDSFVDSMINIHLHEEERGSGRWAETQGIVRNIAGHGMVELKEASLENGTRADRVFYRGRWYECVSSVFYDHTALSHYNYKFIALPEDAMETITLFNAVLDEESGLDVYVPTVITGVAWTSVISAEKDTNGLKPAHKYTIRIPDNADFSGKTYVEPEAYEGSEGTFTFMPGCYIVKGREEENGSLPQLRKKHWDIVTVLTVSDFRKAPNDRHWKIEGE